MRPWLQRDQLPRAECWNSIVHREVPGQPGTTDDDLKRYWLVMTPAGWAACEGGAEVRDSYFERHPPEPKP